MGNLKLITLESQRVRELITLGMLFAIIGFGKKPAVLLPLYTSTSIPLNV